jgi:hypothetical protein
MNSSFFDLSGRPLSRLFFKDYSGDEENILGKFPPATLGEIIFCLAD